MEFKNKIKALTGYQGINLKALSVATKINYANIARWARNENQPNLCDAYRLSKELGCSIDDLVYREEDSH